MLHQADQQRKDEHSQQLDKSRLCKQHLVRGRFLGTTHKARRRPYGFQQGNLASAADTLFRRHAVSTLADRRDAEGLAQGPRREQVRQEDPHQREAGKQAERNMRRPESAGSNRQGIKAADQAGDHRKDIGTEAAAGQIDEGVGHHIQAQQHDGQLQCEAHARRNLCRLQHAADRKAQRKICEDGKDGKADLHAHAQHGHLGTVIAGSVGNVYLAAQIFTVILHRRGALTVADAVELDPEAHEFVQDPLAEAGEIPGIGQLVILRVISFLCFFRFLLSIAAEMRPCGFRTVLRLTGFFLFCLFPGFRLRLLGCLSLLQGRLFIRKIILVAGKRLRAVQSPFSAFRFPDAQIAQKAPDPGKASLLLRFRFRFRGLFPVLGRGRRLGLGFFSAFG